MAAADGGQKKTLKTFMYIEKKAISSSIEGSWLSNVDEKK